MRIQNRITLIFTALTAVVILSLSVFIYIFASKSFAESFFHRLEVRADIVGHAALAENKSETSVYYDLKEKHLGDLPNEQHQIVKSEEIEKWKALRKSLPMPPVFYDQIIRKEPSRYFHNGISYVGHSVFSNGKKVTVISSAVDLYGLEEMDYLKKLLLVGFLIAMVFVLTLSRIFSKQIFLPIRLIVRNVKGISAYNLNQRLVVDGSKDEIADLARTFNDMLDRLEITFEMQNNFVSNASHEFRTPLTVISGEAQIGLSRPEISQASRDSFQNIYKESEKLELLTNSMLNLAQTGFDGKKDNWDELRIDELILMVKGTVDQIMPENQVGINFDNLPEDDKKLIISGNEILLKAAFTNVVLNSCKYSDNKPVVIIISTDRNNVIVEIADQGIGIPEREIAQIYVPFFRASNTGKYKGYGIGLPLAYNIVKMHHGTILVNSEVGVGTRFIINLPIKH